MLGETGCLTLPPRKTQRDRTRATYNAKFCWISFLGGGLYVASASHIIALNEAVKVLSGRDVLCVRGVDSFGFMRALELITGARVNQCLLSRLDSEEIFLTVLGTPIIEAHIVDNPMLALGLVVIVYSLYGVHG